MVVPGVLERYVIPFGVFFAFIFLYVPIVLLVLFSFNSGAQDYRWAEFTLDWYRQLFASVEVWHAVKNSLIVAGVSVFLSVSMGSLLVFFLSRKKLNTFLPLFYANLAVPEIVLAVGLLSFFYFFSVSLGMTTLIAGHTLIGLGYVVPIVYTRFVDLDTSLMEASLDLGATQTQTFFKVILPLMMPAILSAAMLVFIISFDDFVLSFFCSGGSAQTLPMYIFSMIRSGSSPEITALSTMLLGISTLLLIIFSTVQIRKLGGL